MLAQQSDMFGQVNAEIGSSFTLKLKEELNKEREAFQAKIEKEETADALEAYGV